MKKTVSMLILFWIANSKEELNNKSSNNNSELSYKENSSGSSSNSESINKNFDSNKGMAIFNFIVNCFLKKK